MDEQPNVKEFPGNPSAFVTSRGNIIGVTTSEHLKNEGKPLEQILKEVCEEARQYANKIFHEYDYPNGKWYPCGSADIVLRWNQHRDIIKLFQKTATEKKIDYWTGWFGKLHKTETLGWWWLPKLDQGSQSMLYEEEVCRFVRQKLAFANIVVEIRTYID